MTLSGELCSHRVAACHRQQVVAPPKLTWIALFHCLRVIPFLSCFMVLVQECDGGPCSRMWRWFLLNNVTVVLAQECDIGSCSRMWRWFLLKNVTVVLAQECDGGSCSRMWQSFYCMGKQAEVPGIPLTPHLKNWTAGQTNRVYPQIVQRMVTAYSGLARTIYIRCIHGVFGRGITKYTVIYGGYTRLWPTLHIPCHTIRGLYPQSIRKQVNASRFVGAAAMVPLACVRKRSWHRDQVSNANDFPHPT